jgi:hypothetical protein
MMHIIQYVYRGGGAHPGFQVRGSALEKIALSGGRREFFWGISCEKSRFYAKKSYFFTILGGRTHRTPPLTPPLVSNDKALSKNTLQMFSNSLVNTNLNSKMYS